MRWLDTGGPAEAHRVDRLAQPEHLGHAGNGLDVPLDAIVEYHDGPADAGEGRRKLQQCLARVRDEHAARVGVPIGKLVGARPVLRQYPVTFVREKA